MRTKTRITIAAVSDGLFLASVGLGAIAALLEDTSAALRALVLTDGRVK